MLSFRPNKNRLLTGRSLVTIIAILQLYQPMEAAAHGGDSHMDMSTINRMSDSSPAQSSKFMLSIGTTAKLQASPNDAVESEDSAQEPSGSADVHDHTSEMENAFSVSPSLIYRLNNHWSLSATQNLNLGMSSNFSKSNRSLWADTILSVSRVDSYTDGLTIAQTLSLLAPISEESRRVQRGLGVNFGTIAVASLSARWDLMPFFSLNHYIHQDREIDDDEAQTQTTVGTMLRYSYRRWNAALQFGGRLQDLRTGDRLINQFMNFVPIRADLNHPTWSLSFYPEIRSSLGVVGRTDAFLMMEGVISFANSNPIFSHVKQTASNDYNHDDRDQSDE